VIDPTMPTEGRREADGRPPKAANCPSEHGSGLTLAG